MVFRIAYSILRNHHDAEDAAQECFLRVWKHKDRLHEVDNRQDVAGARGLDHGAGQDGASGREMVSLNDEESGSELQRITF